MGSARWMIMKGGEDGKEESKGKEPYIFVFIGNPFKMSV